MLLRKGIQAMTRRKKKQKPASRRNTNPSSNQPRNKEQSTRGIAQLHHKHFEGPIPPPEVFGAYEPEIAKTIVQMAQNESKHRHQIETNEQKNRREYIQTKQNLIYQTTRNSQVFAFIILFITITGSIFLLYKGRNLSGAGTFIAGIAPALKVLFSNPNKKQTDKKP